MHRAINRRLVLAVAVVVGTFAGITSFASPADARPPTGNVKDIGPGSQNCPKGYFCVWEDAAFAGRGVAFSGNADHWHHLGRDYVFIDDNAVSAYNNGNDELKSAVRFWVDTANSGASGCMSRGTKLTNLDSGGLRLNDAISSHEWRTSCGA